MGYGGEGVTYILEDEFQRCSLCLALDVLNIHGLCWRCADAPLGEPLEAQLYRHACTVAEAVWCQVAAGHKLTHRLQPNRWYRKACKMAGRARAKILQGAP